MSYAQILKGVGWVAVLLATQHFPKCVESGENSLHTAVKRYDMLGL